MLKPSECPSASHINCGCLLSTPTAGQTITIGIPRDALPNAWQLVFVLVALAMLAAL